jgi:hypothetical protein
VPYHVGTPVGTRAGWRLRVTGTTGEDARAESRGKLSGEELLAAHQLGATGAPLVVLQAEPVDGPPEPLGDLREGFAGLAQALLDAGAVAVLMVQPLPDAIGELVRQAVMRRVGDLRRQQPAPRDLTALAADIVGCVSPGCDVMLYLRPESG